MRFDDSIIEKIKDIIFLFISKTKIYIFVLGNLLGIFCYYKLLINA